MIIVTGAITATPQTRDELLAISLAHVARSRTEPGCISHNVHIDCEDPMRLVFVERWQDMTTLKQHFTVPESITFGQAIVRLGVGRPEMSAYEATPAALR